MLFNLLNKLCLFVIHCLTSYYENRFIFCAKKTLSYNRVIDHVIFQLKQVNFEIDNPIKISHSFNRILPSWFFKGRFLKFRMYHNFSSLFSKLLKSTFYKEISKFQ